jgi:hypothetical protein
MAYDLSSIRQQVRNRLSDQNFDTGMIDQFINDEQREIFNYFDLPFNRTTIEHTVTQGNNTIALPSGHQKTKGLRIISPQNYDYDLSRRFIPWARFKSYFRQDPDYYSDGVLDWWTIYNDNIEFANNADRTYVLEQDYLVSPIVLTEDNDEPELPEEFQEILVLGALVRCLEVNDDNDIAQYQLGKKNLLVQGMLKRLAPQQSANTSVLRNSYRGI